MRAQVDDYYGTHKLCVMYRDIDYCWAFFIGVMRGREANEELKSIRIGDGNNN